MTDADSAGASIPARSEIPAETCWDVESLFADGAAWQAAFGDIEPLVDDLETMRGTLNASERVARFLERQTELGRLLDRLYVYAHLRSDEDVGDTANQARLTRIRGELAAVSARLAWFEPELLRQSEATLREWRASEELQDYRYFVTKLLRRRPHTLSDAEEALLARVGDVLAGPQHVFSLLTNADMRFPHIKDGDGQEQELSQGRYLTFMIDACRDVRRGAFEALYDTFGAVRNTLACTLSHHVKTHNLIAQTRHFGSALEAALLDDNIPVVLYESLIGAVHDALPALHDYIALRRDRLGLDDLDMHDIYVPIVPDCDLRVPFEQARDWVLAACRPLGSEYVAALQSAFTDRWLDVCENRGKRSGAYSSGCYDSLPFILMNYQGRVDDVFTLAHELGHSVHSWLANRAQPPQTADYPIFVAEIASTANEGLLLHYLLETQHDPRFRAYLLNHLCDGFRTTVYRQTMFAEFEKHIHEKEAGGDPLTPDLLCDDYYGLNAAYHGASIRADRRIALEWARIPHFYYNFYVYKYATSFCASQLFLDQILAGGSGRDRFLNLLRAGGSADPLDLVRAAGVDLSDTQTLRTAFGRFARAVTELRAVLEALPAQGTHS